MLKRKIELFEKMSQAPKMPGAVALKVNFFENIDQKPKNIGTVKAKVSLFDAVTSDAVSPASHSMSPAHSATAAISPASHSISPAFGRN